MTTILQRLHAALAQSGHPLWIIAGQDNLRYATGVHAPFTDAGPALSCALLKPGGDRVLAPALWASMWEAGRVPHVRPWDGPLCPRTFIETLVALLERQGLDAVGLDVNRASAALLSALEQRFTVHDISPLLAELRAAKDDEEAELLDDLAYRADHAILGATHHSLACDQRAEKGLAEIIRIHGLERGFEAVGYNAISQAATGAHAGLYWAEAPKFGIGQGKRTARGEFNRLDLQASLNGYWACGSRLMTMGWPTEAQRAAYEALVAMREAALAIMRPGVACSTVYAAMREAALKQGAVPVEGRYWGHSLGVSPQEAPYIAPGDHTPLADNAVMVLLPHVAGPDGERLYARDTVKVNACGCVIMGWYKDWREPYVASDSYYSGGG